MKEMLVAGDRNRIFINTGLGCEGGCQYCYLSQIGIGEVVHNIDRKTIINEVECRERKGEFVKGADGTIVSFGCFTECWDKNVRKLTIEILIYFLNKGNYIQMATKRYIEREDMELLNRHLRYKNQLTINVSLPVFYGAQQIEPHTESVEKRIENFKYNKRYNIDMVLYIKPVIEDITIHNLNLYIELIRKYDLKVIVGKFLQSNYISNALIQVVGSREMWQRESQQQEEIVNALRQITTVYENSVQVIEEYRGKGDIR